MLVLLLALGSYLLTLPSVQTYIGKKITGNVNKNFDVDINIGKIDFSYSGDVYFSDVLIKDHHADTLIFANTLKTSIYSYQEIKNQKYDLGEIVIDNFDLNIKVYEGEEKDALSIFVDKLSGKSTGKKSNFLLQSTNLVLKNGDVLIVDQNKPDSTPLSFKGITGNAQDFKIEGANVTTAIENLNFTYNNGLAVTNFTSDFEFTKQNLYFLNSLIETKRSTILADIKFDYKREDFGEFNDKVNLTANIHEADVAQSDLNFFYNEIGTDDVLHFSTTVKGQLNNLTFNDLRLRSDKGAVLIGDVHFDNIFNKKAGFSANAHLVNLTSDYYHLQSLLPNLLGKSLPSSFKSLGRFTLTGNTYITTTSINSDLTVNSALGTIITDLNLTNINNIDYATYSGDVRFIDFKLGQIINNNKVGKVTMEADIQGSGFTLPTLNTAVKGKIDKINYNGYTYNGITVDGVVKNQHFNGEVEVNDDNLKLNFNGLADLSTDVYKFNFKSIVDYSNLNAIKLFDRDSIANFKGNIDINLQGTNIDNMVGSINFTNTLYTNQKQDYFFKDFEITSEFEDSVRVITINSSEIIEGRLRGNFKFNELLKLTKNSIGSIYTNYKPYKVTPGQNVDFNFKIYNKIVEVFFPEVTLAANTTISGKIASDDNEFKLRFRSPKVLAYGTEVDSILLQIDNKNPLFNTQLSVDRIDSKLYDIHNFELINRTINDTLYFRSEFKGGESLTETYNLSFYHTFNEKNKSVFGLQQSDFTFKDNKWNINPTGNNLNKIVYDNKTDSYQLLPFTIVSGNQKVNIEGVINDSISKDLKFNFEKVKLSSITPHIDSLNLKGELNGTLNYKQINNQLKPSANLTVSNFTINNSFQGNLDVAIEGQNSLRNYNVNVSMERDGYKNLEVTGNINFVPNNPTLNLTANFEEFKLDAFSALGKGVISNIRGFAYGTATINGSFKNPQMAGELYLDEAGMSFPLLNVDYDFKGTSVINLDGNSFVFEDVTLLDTKHQTTGNLVGTIYHNNFKKWNLALRVNTNNLLVLDTEPEEDSLYYGTGYLAGTATIFGPTDQLVVNVQGKTMPNTHFVIPLSDVKTVGSSKLIRFVNSENEDEDEQLRRQFFSDKLKGFALNFNIEVTKDAVIEMVLDKSTGSYLKGSGTGNLQIEIDAQDKFNMYGDFIVDNGIYNFKYGGFINKPFIVRKGGSISWSGDPLTANINIEAVYRVSANPRFLLENLSSSRKIPIDLVTRFSGELFDSQRDFDIEIPNSSSTVSSELAFVLNENDQNRKTLHFMSLLATGSFFNETDFSVNANSFAYGTTSDLLSNAFDNIFNQGENKFRLKPVYTVGERSKVDNIDIYDQLALDLAYQVNDRVLINGKVGVPIGSKEQSNVIGEVNVEFLLNEEGTLRSSIFNRQNEIQYTEQEEGYTQGVGLSYQIDFDTGRELLEKLGLKKKEEPDSTAVNAIDSVAITNKIVKFKTRKTTTNE